MISYLLFAVMWSTAFVLWALGPIVADAHQAAGRGPLTPFRTPYLQTAVGVFLAFLAGGLIASLWWTDRVFGMAMPDQLSLAFYLILLAATIMTLRPHARTHPWTLRLHNAGLIGLALIYLAGR